MDLPSPSPRTTVRRQPITQTDPFTERIVALQRNATPAFDAPSSPSSRPGTSRRGSERDETPLRSSTPIGSQRSRREAERSSTSKRSDKPGEFDRGPLSSRSPRQLYDPSMPPPLPVPPRRIDSPASPAGLIVPRDERRREQGSSRRKLYDPDAMPVPIAQPSLPSLPVHVPGLVATRPRARPHRREDSDLDAPAAGPSGRTLYDPSAHDTQQGTMGNGWGGGIAQRNVPSPSVSTSGQGSRNSGTKRVTTALRSPEEEADRDRERQRRREARERASQGGTSNASKSRKQDSDSRSSGSSQSLKDRERGRGEGDSGALQYLKKVYNLIKEREKLLEEMHRKLASNPQAGMLVLIKEGRLVRDPNQRTSLDTPGDAWAWNMFVAKHKELAEYHSDLLKFALDPKNPKSLRGAPTKHNIPARLWKTTVHSLLERLRLAHMSNNPVALDILTDVIYDAYQFYTELFQDPILESFRQAWIEALGDLARYRMAMGSLIAPEPKPRVVMARIDDDDSDDDNNISAPVPSGASIGQEVADNWDPECNDSWRTTAREWYAMGIAERPLEGRLHHHLALLCYDTRGLETRALYHFVKSLTVSHPYATSRESILPLFETARQAQRSAPDATAMDLFVRLHGMLFTRIQLDDFAPVMSRFMERLEEDSSLDGVSRKASITQVDWLFMGVVNLGAVLQYGAKNGMIRKSLSRESGSRRRQQATEANDVDPEDADEGTLDGVIEEDDSTTQEQADEPAPYTYLLALDLAFGVLDFVLTHPFRQQGLHQVINPYLTIMLTFLATVFRQSNIGAPFLTKIPWRELASLINAIDIEVKEETRLIAPAPLPEDWVMRGLEWVGRRVYERGFWKPKGSGRGSTGAAVPVMGEPLQSEMDVILSSADTGLNGLSICDGVVDEEEEGADVADGPVAVNDRRRKRIQWAAGTLATCVDGFELEDGRVYIRGSLAAAIDSAKAIKEAEEAEAARLEAQRRARMRRPDLDRDRDRELNDSDFSDEDDDPELADLRERRRHLQEILKSADAARNLGPTIKGPSRAMRSSQRRIHHKVVPGYTILMFDTNVLLSALSLVSKIVEGGQWSVVIPLPVVTELDGLSKNPPPLGTEAQAAVSYLEARVRTHALCLKIQTTKGNYLTDLLIRAEHLDFHTSTINSRTRSNSGAGTPANGEARGNSTTLGANVGSGSASPAGSLSRPASGLGFGAERQSTMDDMILNVASFQAEHFVDRSALLGMGTGHKDEYVGATQVLLVTFDRTLRLKARSRGIDAADEKEMAAILGRGE